MEKQKPAAQYNITEQQLRNYLQKAVRRAQRIPDITSGDVLMQLLETHLDAVEMRAGLARTIHVARQYVSHGHILVNSQRVNPPAYQVQVGDVASVRPESRRMPAFTEALEGPIYHHICSSPGMICRSGSCTCRAAMRFQCWVSYA
jgi:small subunit ribosomal protein S4